MKWVRFLLPGLIIALLLSCTKESFSDNPQLQLRTTTDSLSFDTVFTSAGSVTGVVKIANDNNKGIRLSAVRLAGGAASPFRINVDGIPGPLVNEVEVGANDSVYVFVSVFINPTAANQPFLVTDSIVLNYNGNTQFVKLTAYGQNARYLNGAKILGNQTWNNQRPYVILGGLTVDTNAVLTIEKGTRIYLHANAPLVVHGSLRATGDSMDSTRIRFTGDRLDAPYRGYPASWPGLVFTESSRNNLLRYVQVLNAYQGISVYETPSVTKLTLEECTIENAYDAGLLAVNAGVRARNLLVSNCGRNLVLAKGGNYAFDHCTIAAYSNAYITHREPALLLTDFVNTASGIQYGTLNASFRNSIIWGEANGLVASEVELRKLGPASPALRFENVLWRVAGDPGFSIITGAINGQDPQFELLNHSRLEYSFRLQETSPALNKGINTGVAIDLDGHTRPVGLPDLGAYERQ